MSLLLLHRAATMPAAAYRTPTHKLALLCLADSAGDGDGIALPGREALEAWTCVGRSRLYEVLEELVADGLVARVSAGGKGRGRARFRVFPSDYPDEGSALPDPSPASTPAPDPLAAQGPVRVRSGSGQGPAVERESDPVREYGSTGGAGGEVQTSPTERAPADGPAPRPLSAQARETLRVREEQQAARDRATQATRRRPKLLVPPTARQRALLERCRPGRPGLVRGKDTDVLLGRGWVRYEGDREDVVLLTDAGREVIGPDEAAASG